MFDGSNSKVADTSYGYAKDSALNKLDHNLFGTSHDVKLGFNYNAVNQMVGSDINNASYNYQGAFQQQHLDYDVNGLNQYTEIYSLDETETVLQTSNMVYDDNGNLTSDGAWTYSYDVENRLVRAHKTDSSQTTTFEYGPKGRRYAKVSNNVRTEYVYDGDEPIADYASNGQVLRQYVNGQAIDERLMYLEYSDNGSGTYTYTVSHYYRNHQGSIIALSKSTDGTLLEKYTYDAYGNIGQGEGGGQPFRYTGRRYDNETGLYYYRARYYSPKLGRFLQTDLIGYEDNMNMYGYTGNDPVNMVDPSGLAGSCAEFLNRHKAASSCSEGDTSGSRRFLTKQKLKQTLKGKGNEQEVTEIGRGGVTQRHVLNVVVKDGHAFNVVEIKVYSLGDEALSAGGAVPGAGFLKKTLPRVAKAKLPKAKRGNNAAIVDISGFGRTKELRNELVRVDVGEPATLQVRVKSNQGGHIRVRGVFDPLVSPPLQVIVNGIDLMKRR